MTTDKAQMFLSYWRLLADGLDEPTPEYEFNLPESKHRFDFCWPAKFIAVEIDGGQWKPHGGRHGTDGDREKRNLAASAGFRIFFFSPAMLEADPQGCIDRVARAVYGFSPTTLVDGRENG